MEQNTILTGRIFYVRRHTVDEQDKQMAEIRESLVEISTDQKHILKMLEDSRARADDAYEKADSAEDKAQEALRTVYAHQKEYYKRLDRDDANRKFTIKTAVGLIGTVVTILIFLTPILISYYTP